MEELTLLRAGADKEMERLWNTMQTSFKAYNNTTSERRIQVKSLQDKDHQIITEINNDAKIIKQINVSEYEYS